MAPLATPHWEAVTPEARRLLTVLGQLPLLQPFYLGGGTALALCVNGQAVSFFTYGYPLLEPTDRVAQVQVAGLVDIGLMKLDAIAGRGMRKDFYDLYFIASHVTLVELFDRGIDKYPESQGFEMRVLTALVDFGAADQEEEPMLLLPASWEEVKAFFVAESRRIGREWFGLAGMERV